MDGNNEASIAKKQFDFTKVLMRFYDSSALPDINTDNRRGDNSK